MEFLQKLLFYFYKVITLIFSSNLDRKTKLNKFIFLYLCESFLTLALFKKKLLMNYPKFYILFPITKVIPHTT